MKNQTALIAFNLALALFWLLCFLIGLSCLFPAWNKPFLKPRIPFLVLVSALGFLISSALLASILLTFLRLATTEANQDTSCIISYAIYTVLDILVFWPVILRLYYVRRVASFVKAFYANSDEELAKVRERKVSIVIFILMAWCLW